VGLVTVGLYDRIMQATENPTNVAKVTTAASNAAQIAANGGHSGAAVAAGVAGALFVAADRALHAPSAAPEGGYATFRDDGKKKRGKR
jgi:hypothetical protein